MLAFIRLLSARQLKLCFFFFYSLIYGCLCEQTFRMANEWLINLNHVNNIEKIQVKWWNQIRNSEKKQHEIIFRIEIVYWIHRFYALSRISLPLKCTNCVAISLFFSVLQHFTNKSSLDKKKEKAVYIFQTRDNHFFSRLFRNSAWKKSIEMKWSFFFSVWTWSWVLLASVKTRLKNWVHIVSFYVNWIFFCRIVFCKPPIDCVPNWIESETQAKRNVYT